MEEHNNETQSHEQNDTAQAEAPMDSPMACDNCATASCDGTCAMDSMNPEETMETPAGMCKCGQGHCKCSKKKMILKVIGIIVIIYILTLIF